VGVVAFLLDDLELDVLVVEVVIEGSKGVIFIRYGSPI
jgi:hypothetical protein